MGDVIWIEQLSTVEGIKEREKVKKNMTPTMCSMLEIVEIEELIKRGKGREKRNLPHDLTVYGWSQLNRMNDESMREERKRIVEYVASLSDLKCKMIILHWEYGE